MNKKSIKLNIHLISHPLIQNLCNTRNNILLPSNITNQITKYLGLFIIYETVRRWIKVYKLTIKQIESNKEIITTDPKGSYTIIFDNINHLSMLQEVPMLLPKVDLRLITTHEINNIHTNKALLTNLNLYTKIIIVNDEINTEYTKKIIKLLITEKKIDLKQIYLTCITCTTDQLIQLSKLYNNISIYTTKIIKH